jgi:hypothetical protein
MAKYRVTIESTMRLSREVEANSSDEAERLAESIYQEYENCTIPLRAHRGPSDRCDAPELN